MIRAWLLQGWFLTVVGVAASGCGEGSPPNADPTPSKEAGPADAADAPTSSEEASTVDSPADAFSDSNATNWDACSAPGDCVIVRRSCCAGFYVPGNYAAINRAKKAAWDQAECPDPRGSSCDATFVTNHRLLAFCQAGKCEQIVVPEDPISACSTNADCVVVSEKAGQCAEIQANFSVRADQLATYAAQVCPACTPTDLLCPLADGGARDSGLPQARCATDGHCHHAAE